MRLVDACGRVKREHDDVKREHSRIDRCQLPRERITQALAERIVLIFHSYIVSFDETCLPEYQPQECQKYAGKRYGSQYMPPTSQHGNRGLKQEHGQDGTQIESDVVQAVHRG